MPSFDSDGFEMVDDFISLKSIEIIIDDLTKFAAKEQTEKITGIRNADKKILSVAHCIQNNLLIEKAKTYLGQSVKLVRAIIFYKSNDNNWFVTWHQDRTVAVSNEFDCKGWGPWSVKDGVINVQPPLEVLNQMITFRVNLDNVDYDNGCLKVIPKSHMDGVLDNKQIRKVVDMNNYVNCVGAKGSALIMRPHLVHSSSKALNITHRRILHLEFCSYKLPNGVHWV